MAAERNGKRTGAERPVNERMAALGRRSGEARRKRKTEPSDHEKAHDTLVESLQSPSAIARIQAARELLSRKPADPEPEPRQYVHGTNLTELLVHAVGYGVMPANTVGDVGLLTQALALAAASSGHTQQAESIRARLIVLGSNPPPAPPPDEKGHPPSALRLNRVPPVGGSTGVPVETEIEEDPMDGVGGFFKAPDSDAFVSESDRRLAEMIAANEQLAYEGRVMVELGLDEGGSDGVE